MLLNSPFHRDPGNPTTWEQYLGQGEFPVDTGLYTDENSKLIVDKLYRYEELPVALADIGAKTGIKNRPLNIREKSGYRYNVPTFLDIKARSDQCDVIWKAFETTLRFIDYS
jgi:hypothetical protein